MCLILLTVATGNVFLLEQPFGTLLRWYPRFRHLTCQFRVPCLQHIILEDVLFPVHISKGDTSSTPENSKTYAMSNFEHLGCACKRSWALQN